MNPSLFVNSALLPALSLLPEKMNSEAARIQIMAIGFQESRMLYRKQIGGPARGYFQFEKNGGVKGVLTHHSTKDHIKNVLGMLDYDRDSTAEECYYYIEHNDILAVVFARLLLWSDPNPLVIEEHAAWNLYLRTWRPGKPHIQTWGQSWNNALSVVSPGF